MSTGRTHWSSVIQFGLSALAVFNLLSGASLIGIIGITKIIVGRAQDDAFADPLQLFLMAAIAMTTGFLLLPSTYYAFYRILGRQVVDFRPTIAKLKPALWLMLVPFVLTVGYWISSIPTLSWLVLPPLHVLAVGLPIAWILYISVRNLPLGSPQRMWGVLSCGLFWVPMLAFVLEGLAGLAFLIFGIILIANRPDIVDQIHQLAQWMRLANPPPEMVLEKLGPWLVRPMVIWLVLIFGAVIVPLLEEALKPMGVWLLIGRRLTPAAGFAVGAVSGAAFALSESLVLTSDGQQWVSMMIARIGAAIIHTFTSGLIGWGLVQARYKRGRIRLVASYLTSISIHGLWNALSIFAAFSVLAISQGLESPLGLILPLGKVAPVGLVLLASGTFVLIQYSNRTLRTPNNLARNSKSSADVSEIQ